MRLMIITYISFFFFATYIHSQLYQNCDKNYITKVVYVKILNKVKNKTNYANLLFSFHPFKLMLMFYGNQKFIKKEKEKEKTTITINIKRKGKPLSQLIRSQAIGAFKSINEYALMGHTCLGCPPSKSTFNNFGLSNC